MIISGDTDVININLYLRIHEVSKMNRKIVGSVLIELGMNGTTETNWLKLILAVVAFFYQVFVVEIVRNLFPRPRDQ